MSIHQNSDGSRVIVSEVNFTTQSNNDAVMFRCRICNCGSHYTLTCLPQK